MIWVTLPASTGRQLDEFGEDVKTRGANVDIPGLDASLGQQLLQRLLRHRRFARGFLRAFGAQGLDADTASGATLPLR